MSESEVRGEAVNDTVDQLRDLGEQSKNGLSLNNLRLAERYLEGGIETQILFRRNGVFESPQFCVVLRRRTGSG